MSKDNPERRLHKSPEADSTGLKTTAKVASDCVTDDPQALAYEPKFKSFSGQSDLLLPVARSMAKASEFVIEDKEAGKEHTAGGERYVARPSFLTGLQAQLKGATTAEEAECIQSAFSIEYMLKKAREFFSAAASNLGLDGIANVEESEIKGHATHGHQFLQTDFPSDHEVTVGKKTFDANSIIADAHEGLSDASPSTDVRTWKKAENPPVDGLIWLRAKTGVKECQDYIEQWEVSGEVHEVDDVPQAILDTCSSLINDPHRDKGETSFAFGEYNGKIYMSSVWFNPGVQSNGSELQEPLGIAQLRNAFPKLGWIPLVTIVSDEHSHPYHKDKAYWTFSPEDLRLGQQLDGFLHTNVAVNRDKKLIHCLLTPAKDGNRLVYYESNYESKDKNYVEAGKNERIKELGRFSSDGSFVPNENEKELLKELGFTKS